MKPGKGEEIIKVLWYEDGQLEGEFVDSSNRVKMLFEGELRFGYLFVKYWAPPGQNVMQDGCCCLTLQPDGSLRGYFADFSGCGTYELKLDQPR